LVVEGVVAAMVIVRGWVGGDLEGQSFFFPSIFFLIFLLTTKIHFGCHVGRQHLPF
jgi:hypothetical protein